MLEVAMGAPGSFCDNCAAPATRGYELRSPLSSQFFCECCAERKFGAHETGRAKSKIQVLKDEVNRLSSAISAPKPEPTGLRPVGFLR